MKSILVKRRETSIPIDGIQNGNEGMEPDGASSDNDPLLSNYGAVDESLDNKTGSVEVKAQDYFLEIGEAVTTKYPFDDLTVPENLRSFVQRLDDYVDLTEDEFCGVLFIICIADSMMKVGYASFLTRSFVDELRKKLDVEELDMEIEIAALRWTFDEGAIMGYHRFSSLYDGLAMQELSRIALGVLEDSISVTDGLREIERCLEPLEEFAAALAQSTSEVQQQSDQPLQQQVPKRKRKEIVGFEKFYRQYPGRVLTTPILASTCCVVYYGGTTMDLMVCLLSGTVAGLIGYLCSEFPQLSSIKLILVAAAITNISTLSIFMFPGEVCFRAQVLGSIMPYFFGIAFVLSLYEITQDMIITGITRFFLATLKSFELAFGVAIGLWVAGFGSQSRFDDIDVTNCSRLDDSVDPVWFTCIYPILAVGVLMDLRVSPVHWPVCLLTQLLSVKSQYLLSIVWKQPIFISNFIPGFLATVSAQLLIVTFVELKLSKLSVASKTFLFKSFNDRESSVKKTAPRTRPKLTRGMQGHSSKFKFVNHEKDDPKRSGSTRRNDKFQYQRSDLWFCLAPSLYLLVPGAAIWNISFFSIVESSSQNIKRREEHEGSSFQTLISGVFVVGMGLVMGVRFGLAVIWAFSEVWRKRQRDQESSPT
ncbi:hypothetical protein ACA910_017595 [Epithemia clementina (nom. ined.)]